jgi:hypothetical protein
MDGGLVARFGDIFVDQSDDPKFLLRIEAGLAASASKAAANQQHTARKGITLLQHLTNLEIVDMNLMMLAFCSLG